MPWLISERGQHTSWLVWLAAILCAILAIVVIITGIVVLAIYLIYQPRMPCHLLRPDLFDLNYLFQSSPIPLDEVAMETMDMALKKGVIPFDLNGQARTRWRVGIFLSLTFWTHPSCQLHFFWPNGSTINLDCSSKSH
ncbi:uncharacterized protein LOC103983494 [Musa acuminata AAA Group]|uniref:uncharacterized protein LOC103983494 n=1 Tax=Musa acuminata AAA Group TaxID=214697 RepID=UPI0031DAB4C5